MTSIIIGVVASVISVILGVWKIVTSIHHRQLTQERISMHLDTGDRFVALGEFEQAVTEYQKILELDKKNIEALRRIVSAKKEIVRKEVFLSRDNICDFGLHKRFTPGRTGVDEQINEALTILYQLQALNPKLKEDVNLLLDEAGILKTGGIRAKDGIKSLSKVLEIEPDNDLALAELGAILVSSAENEADDDAGLKLIRRALEINPAEARYHYYLAYALYEIYECDNRNCPKSSTAQTCAESIREFQQSIVLASDNDIWSRNIRYSAAYRGMEIFRSYVTNDSTILSPDLAMSYEERIALIESFLQQGVRLSGTISEIRPLYWLADLNHALGKTEIAEQHMRQLMSQEGGIAGLQALWIPLFIKILEANDHRDETYRLLKSLVEEKIQEEPVA